MRYLAVFRGRSAAIRASRVLEQRAIPMQWANAPRETGFGCGIAIAVTPSYYAAAAQALPQEGFVGWWLLTEVAGGTVCTRV